MMTLLIIGSFALFLLAGIYKGFLWNLSALGASLISLLLAALLMGGVSRAIESNDAVFDAMLSYTEGSEAIYDIELAKLDVTSLTNTQIDEVMERSNLPFPLRERVYENIMSEALKERGITTLGDYFNESIVLVIINVLAFLLVYIISRAALTILISWLDYTFKLPRLRHADAVAGGAIGLLRGVIDISVIFMVTPIVLMVLPFEQIEDMFTSSALASFLHRSNILLKLIPGVI